ncbi:transporter substrate-binding domain-containing protein [Pseudogemmobacter bohemicus]|uniref:transporter substrate-binding domain-containing protein n=1 Tax=Pseudogemmobacter bohemicus TaxID=2250708 RepID=UPI000DD3658D
MTTTLSISRRSLLISSAAAAIVPTLSLAGDSTEFDRMMAEKRIRAGAVEAMPWFERDFSTGEWSGLVPDILTAIFEPQGIHVEYVETQWGTAVAGLQSQRFDLMGAYNETPERAAAIDFTDEIGGLQLSILTLKGNAESLGT